VNWLRSAPGIMRGVYWRIAAVLALVGLSYIVFRLISPSFPEIYPGAIFFPAVLLAALLGGMWAGIAATILSVLLSDYLIFAPVGSFTGKSPSSVLFLTLYMVYGTSISLLIEGLNRYRRRLAIAHEEAALARERSRAEEESRRIAFQREQLRALADGLEKAREEERTRVARDLHDDIGQILTAVKMDLMWIDRQVSMGEKEVHRRLESAVELINEGAQSVRKICSGLRPAILDDLGLGPAMEWQTNEFSSRTGIACRTTLPPTKLGLSTNCASAFFRIFQECLTNIGRHAHARTVDVSLFREGEEVVMIVQDDGEGIRDIARAPSLGILGMKERAQSCGGELLIDSSVGRGTAVMLRIPVHSNLSKEDGDARIDR